jgi:hypothetical protein
VFSLGTPVSSANKTDGHNIAEILLKEPTVFFVDSRILIVLKIMVKIAIVLSPDVSAV